MNSHRSVLVAVSWGALIFVCLWYILLVFCWSDTVVRTVQPTAYVREVEVREIIEGEIKPRESIFFIVSAKVKDANSVPINARQACGIESAAFYHPEKDVYVLIVTPVEIEKINVTHNKLVELLQLYPNVKLRLLRAESFLRSTPAGVLLERLKASMYPIEHTSDILRYALLYKYGGVYLDTDVILLKRLPEYNNYIGVESEMYCGAGVFHFGMDRVGRELANATMDELIKAYDPKEYSTSGPVVITNVLRRRCHKSNTFPLLDNQMKMQACDGFILNPRHVFYGVPFQFYKLFFTKGRTPEVMKMLEDSTTIHYWNHMTTKMAANVPGIPFYDLAQTQCPKIHYNDGGCESDKICELNENELRNGKNIFFIVTSEFLKTGSAPINARQGCGMESAALNHRERDVYVLISVPEGVGIQNHENNPTIATLIKEYVNVKFRTFHVKSMLQSTPMDLLYEPLQQSLHPVEHTSDVMRYTILYKYPGTYLDTDVILLKRLPEHDNYGGAEQSNWIGAGVINFGNDQAGRRTAKTCARQLMKWFDGKEYSASGPKVLTRALFEICEAAPRGDWMLGDIGNVCQQFTIFPWWKFYGVPVQNHLQLFTKGQLPQIERQLTNSTALHYWNHLTAELAANESHIPFYEIARKHCPKVFEKKRHLF